MQREFLEAFSYAHKWGTKISRLSSKVIPVHIRLVWLVLGSGLRVTSLVVITLLVSFDSHFPLGAVPIVQRTAAKLPEVYRVQSELL